MILQAEYEMTVLVTAPGLGFTALLVVREEEVQAGASRLQEQRELGIKALTARSRRRQDRNGLTRQGCL